jgi:hypothetical protein
MCRWACRTCPSGGSAGVFTAARSWRHGRAPRPGRGGGSGRPVVSHQPAFRGCPVRVGRGIGAVRGRGLGVAGVRLVAHLATSTALRARPAASAAPAAMTGTASSWTRLPGRTYWRSWVSWEGSRRPIASTVRRPGRNGGPAEPCRLRPLRRAVAGDSEVERAGRGQPVQVRVRPAGLAGPGAALLRGQRQISRKRATKPDPAGQAAGTSGQRASLRSRRKAEFSAPTPWRSRAPSPRVVPGAATGEPGRANAGPLSVSLLDGRRPARFGAVVCAPLVRAAVPHSREAALVQVGDADGDDLAELAAVIAWGI